ncbi:MAG: hypothetical protein OEO20_01645 [Gemmatimonadota bacterium]|nr:hypothetical protein [Gemmatimonadota bacterium]MDH3366262.1 hypothetical protein [Gemmatimonadota bacterium]MDH3476990.1 hypothetical protein [Gemmatimonadota bacterium]MDH5548722.1 hypothetical protein [Gemmatimonadota bacterium]
MKRLLLALMTGALVVAPARAQTVPETSPAARVEPAYRRTPQLRVDPFRHVLTPRWGMVFSVGAFGSNNALSAADIRALVFLENQDSLLISDILNAIGLIPLGKDALLDAQAEAGVYLGGPLGGHLSLGLSYQGRGYGSFVVDREMVSLLLEGNAAQQQFSVGDTKAGGLATQEIGAHAMVRLGPLGSEDGVHMSVGAGGRYLLPIAYGEERTLLEDAQVLVSGQLVSANVDIQAAHTPNVQFAGRGSGIAMDFLLRMDWPTSGVYFEGLLGNIGKVTIDQVERRRLTFNVNSTDIQEIADSLEAVEFAVQDTVDGLSVTLPRFVRFSGGAWANRILQLDMSATVPLGGDFQIPLAVDLWSTWRLVPAVPLRLGLVLGGSTGIGYTAGIGVETRNLLLQVMGGSFGGWFNDAKGAAARFELGVFF